MADIANVAARLTIDFTADLIPDSLKRFGPALAQAWVAPGNAAMPVLALSTKLAISGNQLRAGIAVEQQALATLRKVGGRLILDLVCDYLLDVRGVPVSPSLALVVGTEGPAVPGGLLRLSIPVST